MHVFEFLNMFSSPYRVIGSAEVYKNLPKHFLVGWKPFYHLCEFCQLINCRSVSSGICLFLYVMLCYVMLCYVMPFVFFNIPLFWLSNRPISLFFSLKHEDLILCVCHQYLYLHIFERSVQLYLHCGFTSNHIWKSFPNFCIYHHMHHKKLFISSFFVWSMFNPSHYNCVYYISD